MIYKVKVNENDVIILESGNLIRGYEVIDFELVSLRPAELVPYLSKESVWIQIHAPK